MGPPRCPTLRFLNVVKPLAAKEGIDLKIVEFTDYVNLNMALSDKELDANYSWRASALTTS